MISYVSCAVHHEPLSHSSVGAARRMHQSGHDIAALHPPSCTHHPAPTILHPPPLHPPSFTHHPAPTILHPPSCTHHPCTHHPSPTILHPPSCTHHPCTHHLSPTILHPPSCTHHPCTHHLSPTILHQPSCTHCPCTHHSAPTILHPASCTPPRCTYHPAPITLHPTLCTHHPAPTIWDWEGIWGTGIRFSCTPVMLQVDIGLNLVKENVKIICTHVKNIMRLRKARLEASPKSNDVARQRLEAAAMTYRKQVCDR